ncbi:MAG: hypothetical protein JXR58_11200, partial [Bacteroidales bacterium]|nr:hypothetical protein [Bacteroidales bacterium]
MNLFAKIVFIVLIFSVQYSIAQQERFYFKENENLIKAQQKRIQHVLDSISGAYENYVRKEGSINDVTLKMYNSQQKLHSETRIVYYKKYLTALDSLGNANYKQSMAIAQEPLTQSQKKLDDLEKAQTGLVEFIGKIKDKEQSALQEIVYSEKGYKKFVKKLKKNDGLDAVIEFNAKCYRLLGNVDLPHLAKNTSLCLAEKFAYSCQFHQQIRKEMYIEKGLKNWAFKKIFKIEKYAFSGKKRQNLSKKYNKKIAKLPYVQKSVAIDKANQL